MAVVKVMVMGNGAHTPLDVVEKGNEEQLQVVLVLPVAEFLHCYPAAVQVHLLEDVG